ncbi:MAG: hypothetical protein KKF77_06475 [Proteobacteria bacterium]|nr:hypothetical protein [Pseudomonadota bacterium]
MCEHNDTCGPDLNRPGQNRGDLHQAYALAFAGEAGKQVLADLSRQGFLRETSFNPDPQRAAFNEGRRSLALYIGHMIAGPRPRRQAEPNAAGGTGK